MSFHILSFFGWLPKRLCFVRMSSVLMIIRPKLNGEKASFQVKNGNKTSFIPEFPVISEDQYLEKLGKNIQIF